MAGREWDAALVEALTETIDYELRAQLALADVPLDREDIAGIAAMVADQVLAEFAVTPRVGAAAAPSVAGTARGIRKWAQPCRCRGHAEANLADVR